MTNVRRAAGAAVLPLAAAAVGIGVGATPADAAVCWPLATASITVPSGTITAGSTVHPSARVSGMLLKAHMQITGPGLNKQVGPSMTSGVIEGSVRVPNPGVFTLTVVGNGTGCVYDSGKFSAKRRPSSAGSTPHRTARGTGARGTTRTSRIPRKAPGALRTPGSASPYRLPPVAPDESGPNVRLPSADPQVAEPPVRQPQPRATNAAGTVPPIKWGQSIAVALVLLLLSAHMGMWSRRQRLAEAGGGRRGPRGTRSGNAAAATTAMFDDPNASADRASRSATAYSGAQPHHGHGLDGGSGSPGAAAGTDTADPVGWIGALREPTEPGRPGPAGTTGREAWTDPRSQVDAADRAGSPGTRDRGNADGRDGRIGSDGRIGPEGRMDAVDWASVVTPRPTVMATPRADANAEDIRAGSPVREASANSTGRTARSGRGYRGRRRRS